MNEWINRQVTEAFYIYRRYVAMQLHFKSGSSYSYPKYNGATNVTIEKFRLKKYIKPYINIKNKIKDIDADKFMFANFINDNQTLADLESPESVKIYEKWNEMYGTHEKFYETCKRRFSDHPSFRDYTGGDGSLSKCLADFLDHFASDCSDTELLIWLLTYHPQTKSQVANSYEDNVFVKSSLDRLAKINEFYEWFTLL